MKTSLIWLACAVLLTTTGCNSHDSVENAQKVNELKNDNATPSTGVGEVEKKFLDFDSEFMAKAASGGLLEVEMGRQVAARATTPQAKEFAQKMVADHTKSNAELKALAARKNITLPTTLGAEHARVLKDVLEKKGANMDHEYLTEMQKDHQEDVKEFTEASVKAADPDIKAFATKNVPVLKMHFDMVTKMLATVSTHR